MGRHRTGIVIVTILLFIFFGWWYFSSPEQSESDVNYLPSVQGELVKHTYYFLDYNETYEQAYWVCYSLTQNHILGNAKRRDHFKEDVSVSSGSAQLTDYKKSGYDRGHLCPAADMKLNQQAMNETFYLSNMSPQHPSFNRGKWKELEEQVRDWVLVDDSLWVVTGPIFMDSALTIGNNHVGIPSHYFKVLYDFTGDQKMLAFVMPNQKLSGKLASYIVPTDSVETLTGIDFFPVLNDSLEHRLEQEVEYWGDPEVPISQYKSTVNSENLIKDGRCAGLTQKGKRCQRKVQSPEKLCWQHEK